MAEVMLWGHPLNLRLADEVENGDGAAEFVGLVDARMDAKNPNGSSDGVDTRLAAARAALDPLFERHGAWFRSLAMQQVCRYHDAEDLVHDAYIHCLRKHHQLRDHEAVVGWIRTIIIRTAQNFVTRFRNRMEFFSGLGYNPRGEPGNDGMDLFAVESDFVSLRIEQQETREVVASVLPELDLFSREAIGDFYLEGLSLKEIMKRRGLKCGTVKRRLHTARQRLRAALENGGYEAADLID